MKTPAYDPAKALERLKSVFGYQSFRPLQELCIRNVLTGLDTLLIMPTGGGKSLCYQIPALIFDGLTIVVSPLISLMQDQVRQLDALGIPAALWNSSLTPEAYDANIDNVLAGRAKLLFLAPETLVKVETRELLRRVRVDCLTIDEAHCISEWGHDFRPEYRELFAVRESFPDAVCLAVTATATERVRADIRRNLGIRPSQELVASFNRPNLFYEVIPKSDALNQAIDFISRFAGQSGIVYCFSRKRVEEVAEALTRRGFSAKAYHAGLSAEARSRHQEQFIRDDVQIIVATIAFGMGINKPNVRFVLHYDLPKNIESYYQETGRAGRDGLAAHCLLLFGYGDIQGLRYLIQQRSDETEKRVAIAHLNTMVHYAETQACRRYTLIRYFGENYTVEACGLCDNCRNPKQPTADLTDAAQKFLNCANRAGQRFGAMHLIDILRGSESEKIKRFAHDKHPAYGTGVEYSVRQWQSIVRQFIQKGLLWQDHDAFGALKLTAQAGPVIKGEARVMGYPPAEETVKAARVKEDSTLTDGPYDKELFERLRRKRKELADANGVPPYVVFSDKSLIDMCRKRPKTLDDFAQVFGVGEKKLRSYGEEFLTLINI